MHSPSAVPFLLPPHPVFQCTASVHGGGFSLVLNPLSSGPVPRSPVPANRSARATRRDGIGYGGWCRFTIAKKQRGLSLSGFPRRKHSWSLSSVSLLELTSGGFSGRKHTLHVMKARLSSRHLPFSSRNRSRSQSRVEAVDFVALSLLNVSV